MSVNSERDIPSTSRLAPLKVEVCMRIYSSLLSATAVAAAALVGIAAAAAEGPKPLPTKITTKGEIQADVIGKNVEEFYLTGKYFTGPNVEAGIAFTEENGTAEGNEPHERKVHCFGVWRSASDTIMETHAFCIETDADGDQVLWRISAAAPHSAEAAIVKNVNEAIMGTGKFAGISGTFNATCQMSWTGYGKYLSICDRKP
jgi:hypothetical protein